MRRVELRPAARRDMLRFERYLNRHSPRAALRMFAERQREKAGARRSAPHARRSRALQPRAAGS
jgi:hypothetical protein